MYPDVEGSAYVASYEHPLIAVGVVLLGLALLEMKSIRQQMAFNGYGYEFLSAIRLNMQNNQLWTNGQYDCSAWLRRNGTIDEDNLWHHIELACGYQLSLDAASDASIDPCDLYWKEHGGVGAC